MLSVIKTAIITIIISFISGVLLDNYKNFAPRILCTMRKAKPMKLYNKKIKVYMLTVRNTSNKTLHHLNINVQGHGDNLKVNNPNISNGLKFDICNDNDDYDVSIPFLSRDDKFTAQVLIEQQDGGNKKPLVTLRSPENFKEVNSYNSGFMSSLFSGQDEKVNDKANEFSKNNDSFIKKLFTNKKVIVSVVSVLLVVYVGILGGEYYNKIEAKVKSSAQNVNTVQPEAPKSQDGISSNNDTSNIEKSASSAEKSASTNNNKKDAASKSASDNSDADPDTEVKPSSSDNKTKKTATDSSSQNEQKNESNGESTESKNKNNQQGNETIKNNSSVQPSEQNGYSQNDNSQAMPNNSKGKSNEQATKPSDSKPSENTSPETRKSPGPSSPAEEAENN